MWGGRETVKRGGIRAVSRYFGDSLVVIRSARKDKRGYGVFVSGFVIRMKGRRGGSWSFRSGEAGNGRVWLGVLVVVFLNYYYSNF